MSLQKALDQIKQDGQIKGEKILYTFIYEHLNNSTWEPRYQYVYGQDIAEAFRSFGEYIKLRDIVVRNICYGTIDDMREKANIIANHHWPIKKGK